MPPYEERTLPVNLDPTKLKTSHWCHPDLERQNRQSQQVVKDYQTDLALITGRQVQVVLVYLIDKVLIEADQPIDLFKAKIVLVQTIELQVQFAQVHLIEVGCLIGQEFLPGQLMDLTVLIIAQEFHPA